MSYLTRTQLLEDISSRIFTNDNGAINGDSLRDRMLNIVNNVMMIGDLPLTGANGGTGVANTGKTITLAGNLSLVGAFNLALTVTGNSTPTFQTGSGTVPYLGGTNTWSAGQTFQTSVVFESDITFTASGGKIGGTAGQKIGFWGASTVVQPTNAITAATLVKNTSSLSDDSATFGGYTIGQIAAALKLIGILA